MRFLVSRRRLMQASSSAVAVGALDSITSTALAKSSAQLRVGVGRGDFGTATIEACVKSFQAETGIRVTPITDEAPWRRSGLMEKANRATIDAGILTPSSTVFGGAKGILEQIDDPSHKKRELDGVILTPITFPSTVVGIATYLELANLGQVGSTTWIILAHSIGSISFVVVIILANFGVAKSAWAGLLQAFTRVRLPLMRPGVIGQLRFRVHPLARRGRQLFAGRWALDPHSAAEDVGEHAPRNRPYDRRGGVAAGASSLSLAYRALRHMVVANRALSERSRILCLEPSG